MPRSDVNCDVRMSMIDAYMHNCYEVVAQDTYQKEQDDAPRLGLSPWNPIRIQKQIYPSKPKERKN